MVKRVAAASNDAGFEVKEWGVCCTRGGNVFRNGFFDLGGVENQIIENRSIDNRQYGFLFGTYTSSNVVGNVAKRNGETGFSIVDAYGSTLLTNVAKRSDAQPVWNSSESSVRNGAD